MLAKCRPMAAARRMLASGSAGGRMLASGSADDIVTEAPPHRLLHKPLAPSRRLNETDCNAQWHRGAGREAPKKVSIRFGFVAERCGRKQDNDNRLVSRW